MATVEMSGVLIACFVLVAAVGAWLLVVIHQRRVVRQTGGLAVALKRGDQRWANGVGRYVGDELIWYRTLSLSPAAALRMPRAGLAVTGSRAWDASRDMALRPNVTIVECRFRGADISLGFPDNGVTGFLSWLEASAPRF